VLEPREVVLARAARRLLGAAAVILDDAGRVLLVRHTYGRLNWELPGGVGEPEEPVVETAVREVREETGLDVAADRLGGIYFDPQTDMHHFVFRCRAVDPAAQPVPSPPEISACDYFAPAELPRPISDFTIRRIEDALAPELPPLPAVLPPRTWLE
jgi:8-oxo-dGTP diphosphatase